MVVGLEVVVNALVKVAGAENNQVNSLSHRFQDIGVHHPNKICIGNDPTERK